MAGSERWYANGLRFACTQCGHCCTTEGYVWVNRNEIRRIAEHLDISQAEFGRRYVRLVSGRRALIDRSDGACIFWDEGCTVYPVRPGQCSTFPFWKENLATPKDWRETAKQCEGIGDGKRYRKDEVDRLVAGESRTGPALDRKT